MTLAPAATVVIFDCDGVLVDSEIVAARVLAREFIAVGFALTEDDCPARYTGISMPSAATEVQFPSENHFRVEQRYGREYRSSLRRPGT
jgi:beta-phosphoglucomutase-like phosphatase (HAD superfamily)